jgi:ribosomal protein S6E (S10)
MTWPLRVRPARNVTFRDLPEHMRMRILRAAKRCYQPNHYGRPRRTGARA